MNELEVAEPARPQNVTLHSVGEGLEEEEEEEKADEATNSEQATTQIHNDNKNNEPPSAKKEEEEDSNEALEDTHHTTVVEPDESENVSAAKLREIRAPNDGLNSEKSTGLDLVDESDDEIERRLLVGSKISEELRKLREQRAKRLSKKQRRQRRRNKKKRRQISGKNLAKMTQTRQSSSSTQAYDATATASSTDSPMITASPLATGLRQHLPNPLNLSSAVQRLLLGKLSGANSATQHNPQVGSTQSLAEQKFPASDQQGTSMMASNAMLQNIEYLQAANEYQGADSHLTHRNRPHLQQSSSDSLFSDSFAQAQASSVNGAGTRAGSSFAARLPAVGNNRQVVPIEIIGLDPAVTNSIIYGGGELQLLDSGGATSPGENSDHQSGASNQLRQLQQTRGLRNTNSDSGSRANLNQPAILHIHHFHTSSDGGKQTVATANSAEQEMSDLGQHQQPQAQEQQNETNVSIEPNSNEPATVSQDAQQIQTISGSAGQNQWQTTQGIQNQQLFVNDKGELVYLAVQNGAPATDESQETNNSPEAGEQASISEPASHENESSSGQEGPDAQVGGSVGEPVAVSNRQQQLFYTRQPGDRQIVPIPMHANGRPRAAINHNEASETDYGGSEASLAQPPENGAQSGDAGKMIMVSYRPSSGGQASNSSSIIRQQSMRGAYNDGQESTVALSSSSGEKVLNLAPNKSDSRKFIPTSFSSGIRDINNNSESSPTNSTQTANSDLIGRLIKQMNASNQEPATAQIVAPPKPPLSSIYNLSAPLAHQQQLSTPASFLTLATNSRRPPPTGPNFRLQARPLLVEADTSPFHASSGPALNQPPWAPFGSQQLAGADLMGSGLISNSFNRSNLAEFASQDSVSMMMDNNSALLSSLINSHRATDLNADLPIGNSSAANLMTSSELLSLLRELKRPSNGSSQWASTLSTQVGPHDSTAATKVAGGRFELTQASNQSPPRYAKNQAHNQTMLVAGAAHVNNSKNQKHPSHQNKENLLEDHLRHPTNHRTSTSGESDLIGDSSGISNLATAFILVISFMTLALIAASLIYRYRRRSMGRCSNLAGRSRLNLTQRTKHFVRSNFVTPSDVSSIKSINLSSGSSTLKVAAGGIQESQAASGKGRVRESGPARLNSGAERYTATKSFAGGGVGGGKCLSTFNGNSATNEKCHDRGHHDEPATDIKTLNTRLQKPSYLKSLISSPAAAASEGKKRRPNNADGIPAGAPGSHYLDLNIKHQRHAATDHKSSAKHCEISQQQQNYGSSPIVSRRPQDDPNRMATINSMGEETAPQSAEAHHTCVSRPAQYRKTSGLKAADGKLSNLPLSRHVVAPMNNPCKMPPDLNGHRL